MTDWVTRQLALLRIQWPDLAYVQAGHWVLLPRWALPQGWSVTEVDIACQIPVTRETAPYAFYVNVADLTYEGRPPTNWTAPAAGVPFPGSWSVFSWAPESWVPTVDPERNPNMLTFTRSFADRFAEGA